MAVSRGELSDGGKGCPPHSPSTEETISLLFAADAFLILQFSGLRHHAFQKHVHEFTLTREAVTGIFLGKYSS